MYTVALCALFGTSILHPLTYLMFVSDSVLLQLCLLYLDGLVVDRDIATVVFVLVGVVNTIWEGII